MGKGKDTSQKAGARDHQARPLTTLRDPAQYGPPPRKVVGYSSSSLTPDGSTSNTGALLPTLSQQEQGIEARAAEEESARPLPPPGPYRADTTGLSTDHLPKPPLRRFNQSESPTTQVSARAPKPKPALPPRLPPRQNSNTVEQAAISPPPYSGAVQDAPEQKSYLNRGSLNRLGSAGVSVPGLNIGEPSNPWQTESSSPTSGPPKSQLNELQSRFSKMSTPSHTSETPSQGTSFAQKQAALKTASSFRNDPSSVSLADAKSAASTANNFRQRHGEQVASGWKSANSLNQEYGIANKVNNYASGGTASQADGGFPTPVSPVGPGASAPVDKKKPPPPPVKRKDLTAFGDGMVEPPPLPLGSKPRF